MPAVQSPKLRSPRISLPMVVRDGGGRRRAQTVPRETHQRIVHPPLRSMPVDSRAQAPTVGPLQTTTATTNNPPLPPVAPPRPTSQLKKEEENKINATGVMMLAGSTPPPAAAAAAAPATQQPPSPHNGLSPFNGPGGDAAAVNYFRGRGVPALLERLVRYLGTATPDDVLAGVARWLQGEQGRCAEAKTDAAAVAATCGDGGGGGDGVCSEEELQACTTGVMLGKGSFARVVLGLLPSGRYVAVKQIPLVDEDVGEGGGGGGLTALLADARKEIQLMTTVRHRNIVSCLGSWYDEEQRVFSLYMEYVGGKTLAELCIAFKGLPDEVAREYMAQIVAGVAALHAAGICHRDIKPENILVDLQKGVLKLCDFGCSKQIDTIKSGRRGRCCMTVAGSPYYMPPEILNEDEGYDGMRADIWSLGATAIQVATGSLPWPRAHSDMAAIFMISQAQGPPSECPEPSQIGDLRYAFICCCCAVNPADRPMADELLHHPYLRKG